MFKRVHGKVTQERRKGVVGRASVWLGRRLQVWGKHLLERYGSASGASGFQPTHHP